ncbi:hypothetical protein E0L13_11225 [Megasphaera sp. SW808]|uniref:hypothetical protein n=1 Tax=Megasphaera sp. SW808 TaxID=2530045 RepID=UPI00143B9319|nr:hypothetical protein [Megasphaera sp. SW808]NJE35584.1 hypothetical protein [Megasphaera sp. SW808]
MYEMNFYNYLLKSKGNEFQDVFYRLMKEVYSKQFYAIKPNGKLGDHGCDGYLSDGTYFQVYSPEKAEKARQRKMLVDFVKLYRFLEKMSASYPVITAYIFVFNNKYDAVITMEWAEKIEVLKRNYPNVEFLIWDNQFLQKLFQSCDISAQKRILNLYLSDDEVIGRGVNEIVSQNLYQDLSNITQLKKYINLVIKYIEKNDFLAPFHDDGLDDIDVLLVMLENIVFNDSKLEGIRLKSINEIRILCNLICYNTSPIRNGIGGPCRMDRKEYQIFTERIKKQREAVYGVLHKLLSGEEKIIGIFQKMGF